MELKSQDNKWVFNQILKMDIIGVILICRGNMFHSLGAATEKAS